MRITSNTLNRHMQRVIQDRYSDMAKLQEQLSTGKRILRPSDQPIDTTNDLKLRSKLAQTLQYKKNIEDGLAFMSVSDTAMGSMDTLIQRVRELAIQASNDTLGSSERAFIQKEVEQLTRQLIALADTNYKGDYVFGGSQTKVEPYPVQLSRGDAALDYTGLKMAYYDPAGQIRNAFDNLPITNILPGSFALDVAGTRYVEGTDYTLDYVTGILTPINPALNVPTTPGVPGSIYGLGQLKMSFDYVGQGKDIYGDPVSTRGDINREIEQGITMPVNIAGDELLSDPVSGLNAIEVLIRFGQRLTTQNGTVINTSIGEIDVVFKNILAGQAKNGARVNRFESSITSNESQYTDISRLQSDLEDADMAEIVTKFSLNESVYNAALKAAARVIQPSLVDFL